MKFLKNSKIDAAIHSKLCNQLSGIFAADRGYCRQNIGDVNPFACPKFGNYDQNYDFKKMLSVKN